MRVRTIRGGKNKRKESTREAPIQQYFIICEKGKTEKNYFEGIAKAIREKYNRETIVIKVKDSRRKKLSDLLEDATTQRRLHKNVYIIFDKDDHEDFDEVIVKAKKRDIGTCWSNECIELWFLLHFKEYNSCRIDRKQYFIKLDKIFNDNNIAERKYDKNMKDIFNILNEYGDRKEAINKAKRILQDHDSVNIKECSKMNPGTSIHELIIELDEYL